MTGAYLTSSFKDEDKVNALGAHARRSGSTRYLAGSNSPTDRKEVADGS